MYILIALYSCFRTLTSTFQGESVKCMRDSRSRRSLLQMDGGALRLTASGGPSSGHCRPAPRSQHPQRALDADRCAGRRHPVLFSAAKSISFSPSAPSQLLLGRAAANFPRPAARSRPFDPACCAAESSDRAHSRLGRPLLPVHRTRGRGGRPGRHHLRVLRQHPGRARRPLSAPCCAQQASRTGRCAEKLFVSSLA